MKKFIKKLLLFSIASIILILLCDLFLPVKVFVYRPWEALVFTTASNTAFYPNATLSMNSVGDLCHHTENAVVKNERWKIDELGFRNDKYIKDADILIIGDSFIAGSGLSQENTICNQIINMDSSLKVYNMAPSSISQFDDLLKAGKINKPKILVYAIVERNTAQGINYNLSNAKTYKINNLLSYKDLNVYIDKIIKAYPLKWIKARAKNYAGTGIKSNNADSKMYFYPDLYEKHTEQDLINSAQALIQYKKYCDSLNIKFCFMAMPDKETVYYDLVPFPAQPDYLFRLDSILITNGLSTINTLKIYNEYRKNNTELLYHLDDSHWNANATKIMAAKIIEKVRLQ